MNKDELQEIKNRGYRRRAISPNDWATILKDVEELIAAVEELQAEVELMRGLNVGNLEDRRYDRKRLVEMEKKLFASQAEVKRLEDLYNTDRVKYLDDITLLQTEVGLLRLVEKRFNEYKPFLTTHGFHPDDPR